MAKTDTARLYLTNVPAHSARRARGYVYWRSSLPEERIPRKLVPIRTIGDVLDAAWTHRAPHYRRKYNNGDVFGPAKRLPGGRRGTTIRNPEEHTSLSISSIRSDVADEMRGMVWYAVTHGIREFEALGLIAGDALDKWLTNVEKHHHDSTSFATDKPLRAGPKG